MIVYIYIIRFHIAEALQKFKKLGFIVKKLGKKIKNISPSPS